jgi:hypothetical protein
VIPGSATTVQPASHEALAGPQLNMPDKASQAPAPAAAPTSAAEKPAVPNRLTSSVGHATPLDTAVPQAPPMPSEKAVQATSSETPTAVQTPTVAKAPAASPRTAPQKTSACVATPQNASPPQEVIQKTAASEPLTGPNLGHTEPVATPATPAPASKNTVPATTPPTIAAKRDGAPVHHLLVNSPRVYLEYRIEQTGPSGIGRVEIWCTRDKGQSWQCLGEDKDRKSPAEVRLPGDGVYGLTLVVSNGLGFGAQPPAPGDTPDWWIEVDTTQPTAQITMVRVATEDVPGVHIGWTSKDRNLGSGPVELSYATTRQGPWLPIVKGLKSEGQYRWVPPMEIGPQAYMRLTVRDLAGNTTITETTQPVMLDDLSRPRAFIAGITTEATSATSAPAPKTNGH